MAVNYELQIPLHLVLRYKLFWKPVCVTVSQGSFSYRMHRLKELQPQLAIRLWMFMQTYAWENITEQIEIDLNKLVITIANYNSI